MLTLAGRPDWTPGEPQYTRPKDTSDVKAEVRRMLSALPEDDNVMSNPQVSDALIAQLLRMLRVS